MNTLAPRIDTLALQKAFVGFDRVLNTFENRFAQQVNANYPPHNIIKIDDYNYSIELAIAGFDKSNISVEVNQEILLIKGSKPESDNEVTYLHRGLATRDFEKSFTIAEHIVVKSANVKNGVLTVLLELVVPEEKKPRTIAIEDLNT